MFNFNPRPSLTDYTEITKVVFCLREFGVQDKQIAKRITEIGAIDLDILQTVLRTS
ncbi:MAG: hypothetical protein GY761_14180 [Hyphomicrobiales bacterium]|nr:hypothetical protein [Hyphomicrobiales bacterium]